MSRPGASLSRASVARTTARDTRPARTSLAFEIQTVLEDLVNHNHDSPCSEACRIVGVAFVEFLGGLDAAVFRRATQADD